MPFHLAGDFAEGARVRTIGQKQDDSKKNFILFYVRKRTNKK